MKAIAFIAVAMMLAATCKAQYGVSARSLAHVDPFPCLLYSAAAFLRCAAAAGRSDSKLLW
jgi:hypothetical protein